MAVSLLHAHQTAIPDDPAADVGADEWNAEHVLTADANSILGNNTGSAGPVVPITAAQARTLLNVGALNAASTWSGLQTFGADALVNTTLFFGAATSSRSKLISTNTNVVAQLGDGSGYADFTANNINVSTNLLLNASSNILLRTNTGFFSLGESDDVKLYRDGAANTLALRNGTAAQAFNVYNTYTDGSNYERLGVSFSSNIARIICEAAGTGTRRQLYMAGPDAAASLTLGGTAGAWNIQAVTGHLLAGADNTYDIGASGANRPRNIYLASSLTAAQTVSAGGYVICGNGTGFYTASTGGIAFPSNGVIELTNAAQTDFSRLQFGGTTSSFPSLKRSSTVLQARLADDSDFAPLQGRIRVHANAAAETPTATHTLRVFDAAGTEYKVLCVAA